MKRYIAPIITTLIIGTILIYMIMLMIQNRITVSADFQGNELIIVIILGILLSAVLYYSTLGGYYLNKPKITLGSLGIIIILCGAYLIIDPREATTFLSDMIRLSGVYVLIAGISGFIGTNLKDTGTGSMASRIKNAEVIEI